MPPEMPGYRDLSPDELAKVKKIKEAYNAVGVVLDSLACIPGFDQRAVAIARTDTQTAAMWAIRAVTRPTSFA